MTPELDSRPDDLETEVDEILQAVDDQLSALDDDETPPEEAFAELRNIGGRASELVEATDPKSLLAAVDTSDDPPDPEKDSLATAMSKSAPGSVAKLRTILTLSKLPDIDDGTLTDRVDQIRDLRSFSRKVAAESGEDVDAEAELDAEADESTGTDAPDEGDADAESTEDAGTTGDVDSTEDVELNGDDGPSGDDESNGDADSGEDDSDGSSNADADSSTAATSDADADDDAGGDPSEQVKQKLRARLGEFRDGVEEYRESLTDEDEGDGEDDDSESGLGRDSSSGRRVGTTFSTVPSRKRGDMTTGTTRFSTMRPGRNRDRRK